MAKILFSKHLIFSVSDLVHSQNICDHFHVFLVLLLTRHPLHEFSSSHSDGVGACKSLSSVVCSSLACNDVAGQKAFFRCDIDKQTPLEGGMGGGSSNCATALWAANKLCGEPASEQDLIEWGGELGSDVSFFLSCGR